MVYPRKYPTGTGDNKNDYHDWNAMVDRINGVTINGVRCYPFTYLVRENGGKYEAINSTHDLVYGGTDDANGVSGDDVNAVFMAAVTDALPDGKVVCEDVTFPDEIIIDIPTGAHFVLEFGVLTFTCSGDALTFQNTVGFCSWCGRVTGQKINIDSSGYASKAFSLININHVIVDIKQISNSTVPYTQPNSVGVALIATDVANAECSSDHINVTRIDKFETGILISADTGKCDINQLFNALIFNSAYALRMERISGGGLNDNTFYNIAADAWGGELVYGFYNLGSRNVYFNCHCWDQTFSAGLIADFFTESLEGNARPRLFGCELDSIEGSVIQYNTMRNDELLTENSGEAVVSDGSDVTHGLVGTPTSVFLQIIGSSQTAAQVKWDLLNSNANTFRVALVPDDADFEDAVSYWKLDEVAPGSVVDSQGANNGTNNGATINQAGQFGKSYLFDGLNDYVDCTASGRF